MRCRAAQARAQLVEWEDSEVSSTFLCLLIVRTSGSHPTQRPASQSASAAPSSRIHCSECILPTLKASGSPGSPSLHVVCAVGDAGRVVSLTPCRLRPSVRSERRRQPASGPVWMKGAAGDRRFCVSSVNERRRERRLFSGSSTTRRRVVCSRRLRGRQLFVGY